MKTNKEFIPLIANGEKRYEFRFKEPYQVEGIYNINGKPFNLKLLCRFTSLDLKIQGIKSESSFIKELKNNLIYPIDKLTLKENEYYYRIKRFDHLYIYEWVEFVPKELEIV